MHGIINTYMYVRIICFQICTSCILYTYNVQTDCRVRKRASKSFDFWKDFRESKGSGMRLIHFIYLSFFLDAVSDLVKACLASFELNSFLHRESFGILPFLLLTIALESKCRGLLLFTRDTRGGSVERLKGKKKANSPRPSFSFAGISPRRSQILTHYYTPWKERIVFVDICNFTYQ